MIKSLFLLMSLAQTLYEPLRIDGLLSADMNGDGRPDLLTQSPDGFGVHLNRGGMKFEAVARVVKIGIGEPGGAALADVNQDGKLDLIAGSHDSYRIAVLVGDGKGGFRATAQSPLIPRTGGKPHNHALTVADLNGDGHLDIVSANIDDGTLTIYWGDGKGSFGLAKNSGMKAGAGAYRVLAADLNRDGVTDLVVGGEGIVVAMGSGGGEFRVVEADPKLRKIRSPHLPIVDWNGDGKLDVVAGPGEDGWLTVCLGDNKGGLQVSEAKIDLGSRGWQFVVADLNRDGSLDIVFAANEKVVHRKKQGLKQYETQGSTWHLTVADFDGDSRDDIASASTDSKSVQFFLKP